MTRRTHRMGAFVGIAAAAALTFGALGAHAAASAPKASTDTDDNYSPAATQVNGHSPSTKFTVGGITVTCTNSDAGGKTPATGIGAFKLKPLPTFNDGSPSAPCTDNVGGTETTVTNNTNGAWKIGLKDAKSDETQTEPNSGDKLTVTVPKAGAIVTVSFSGTPTCTITVAPNGPFKVTGTYDDVNKFTVALTNLPIQVTGQPGVCPLSSTTSNFNAVYTFTPNVTDGS